VQGKPCLIEKLEQKSGFCSCSHLFQFDNDSSDDNNNNNNNNNGEDKTI
jgi:hypothetical protein